jgi:hypothetical protein
LSLGWANYPEGGSAVEAGASSVRGRKDRRLTHSAEIVVRVFRTYGIGITASSMRWNSEFAGFDRARTFVGLTLVSRF